MKNVFGPEVRDLVNRYLFDLENILNGDSTVLKIVACAILGFQPRNKWAKEFALWWQTEDPEELEEGIENCRYYTYEIRPDDEFFWAECLYLSLGLDNFRQQHNLLLEGDVKDAYNGLQKTISWSVNMSPKGQTFQKAMYAWDRQTRKLYSLKHVRHYRRRQCSPKR